MPKAVTNYRARWIASERMWVIYDGRFRIQSSPSLDVAIQLAMQPIWAVVQTRLALRSLGAI
jgi:hypothetical protein